MRQNREELLRKLESVAPGLATREAVEQSSCFVFTDGVVMTFNDEIACRVACEIGVDGAVPAKPLLDLLGKLSEEIVDIEAKAAELVVKGKRRRAGVTLEREVTLPISAVEQPGEWVDLAPDFADAVGVVQSCASKDANQFALTCIHITPECVEACDNYQLARYPVATGVAGPCLVKRDSLKHVTGLGMTQVSESRSWVHYQNPNGLVLSVRREVMEYSNLDNILDFEGTKTTLPGGLSEAVEKAEIFSAESADNNVISVGLKKDLLIIRGAGASGWYEERKKVNWPGDALSFSIAPKMLIEITEKTNDCYIAPGRLKVDGGKFVYVTCLGNNE